MNAASHPIFGIPDIFISILELLSPAKLLKLQQICKHFNSVINEAPSLQRKLCRNSTKTITEDMMTVQISHDPDDTCMKRPREDCPRTGRFAKVQLSPFLSRCVRLGKSHEVVCVPGEVVRFGDMISSGSYSHRGSRIDLLRSTSQSWRTLQLTYPACTRISHLISWFDDDPKNSWNGIKGRTEVRQLENNKGITLGQLVDDTFSSHSIGEVLQTRDNAISYFEDNITSEYDSSLNVGQVLQTIGGQHAVRIDDGIIIQLVDCITDEPWPQDNWRSQASMADPWPGNPFLYDGEEHDHWSDFHLSDDDDLWPTDSEDDNNEPSAVEQVREQLDGL